MDGRCGQQCPISHPEFRPRNLSAQDRELVPQHQQLDVFHVQAAPTTNKRAQQSPNGKVEEGEGHTADPCSESPPEQRHRYWRPSPPRCQNSVLHGTDHLVFALDKRVVRPLRVSIYVGGKLQVTKRVPIR